VEPILDLKIYRPQHLVKMVEYGIIMVYYIYLVDT
jgi:hypothetical protein